MLDDLPIWLNHFENHATHPRQVPPGLDDTLSARERRLIAPSIAIFQLGESASGARLLTAVHGFCAVHGLCGNGSDGGGRSPLPRIIELFIAEEQRHAALLGEFMQDHTIALRHRHWTHGMFRTLRRLAGLEHRLAVLLTAQVLGIVYYRALEVASRCRRLQILCRMLVADELVHVAFESQLLLGMRERHPRPVRLARLLWQRLLFAGATLAVWMTHRQVLRAAGYRLPGFVRDCRTQYAFHLRTPAAHRTRPLSQHRT